MKLNETIWMQPLGPLQTNGYVIMNEANEAIIVDPGMHPEPMLKFVDNKKVVAILLTHAHFDHIGGLEAVRQATNAPVYIHDAEAAWLTTPDLNGSGRWPMVTEPIKCAPRDYALVDGQRLNLAGFDIDVLYTPGHSPGGVSFYFAQEKFVIAGDTLFAGSIGRTDLPGGDFDTLSESIRTKLYALPNETIVYPGHGPETTIEDEKAYNPFVSGRG